MSKNILWTGSHGFIAGYVIELLLEKGHHVWGIDNFWKYGKIKKNFDNHPNFHFLESDAKNTDILIKIMTENKINIFVSGAAIIGGIPMFHQLAYDLLSENEKITCSAFDACIHAKKNYSEFEKIVVVSSSMVFENTTSFPSKENDIEICPPPSSTYGFQKLATEYFAKGTYIQYQIPYTIIRPFNAIGIGEKKAKVEKECYSGNIKLAMSHVVPDLIQKIIKGQYPVKILGDGSQIRHYTFAGDLANAFYECILNPKSLNETFNVSVKEGHTVLELAKIIWEKIKGKEEFKYECEKGYEWDVKCRIPDVSKSETILNVKCETKLEDALDEIIPWIKEQIDLGNI